MKLLTTLLCMEALLIISGVYGIEKKLVFSTFYLKDIDLNTGVVRLLTEYNDAARAMAYDPNENYMYVTLYSTGNIVRFTYPSNQPVTSETIVSTKSFGITFDSVNRHLYWTESSSTGRIMRCNADGSNVTLILNENFLTALTLDIQNRWIYYGQQISPSQIFRTNFDGTNKRVIIKNLPSNVFGIRVDFDVQRLYWMEYNTGDLKSAWFNGSDVKTLVSTNVTNGNFNIDLDGDFIVYQINNQIMKINKSLGQNPTVVYTDTQKIYSFLLWKKDGNDTSFKNTLK